MWEILIFLAALIVSWLLTCGVIFLICLCFGWSYSFAIATGVWLILCLLGSVFGRKG